MRPLSRATGMNSLYIWENSMKIKSQLPKIRVACFIDGFNLYHAIDNLGRNELKWVNLWQLMECFVNPTAQEIIAVYYFSAFAEWLGEPVKRHKVYVRALDHYGVTPVMGRFKEKRLACVKCGQSWIGHEEKQSDVNIAVWMLREAFRGNYDEAFLVSQDSDLVPGLELIGEMPKARRIKIIGPPERHHSKELCNVSTKQAKIKVVHLERCLMPEEIRDKGGNLIAKRPQKYHPPLTE